MRDDPDPFWERLRSCLEERAIDPAIAVLATCFPDDSSFEFGIVVTPDHRVFEFGFDYLHTNVENGVLSEWTETTDRWREQPFRGEVEAALAIVDDAWGT